MTDTPLKRWRYAINYGPDGEQNYANVYDELGDLVSNLKTRHAIAVVEAMNRRPTPTSAENAQEPVGWQYRYKYDDFEWSNWTNYRRPDADDLLKSNVLIAEERRPLFTQDQLDAAVRAERERCAVIAETCDGPYSAPTDEQDRAAADMGDRIAAAIREDK